MTTAANGTNSPVELKAQVLELKQAIDTAIKNKADIGTVQKMQTQLDALDVRLAQKFTGGVQQKSLAEELRENESISRLLRDRKGRAYIDLSPSQTSAIMSRKTVISAIGTGSDGEDTLNPVGVATTGVLQIDRIPGIVAEARQVLKIRNVLSARPTTMQVVDFVRVVTPMSIASPVPEASLKPENQVTFASFSERVKVIATWIPATKQVIEDFTELMGFIQTTMPYYVDLEEEMQLLAGDNAGEDLHGIIPQAAAFNAGLLPFSAAQGWTKIDIIATAIAQINAAKEIDPTFVILNPVDWWGIRLTKSTFGTYIIGDPQSQVRPSLFGLDVVVTTTMPVGQFLVGSGNPAAAEIRDRMGMQIEVSTEHASFFTQNLIAIRAEKRLCMVVKRPNSFISGTFLTSPVTPA
jgi:HK97 family phage major capsid protein